MNIPFTYQTDEEHHPDMVDGERRVVPRARRLGLGVVQNPSHLMLPDLIRTRYGAERAKVDMPVRSLVPSKPAEALTREQALSAYTQGSAYSEFADHEKGTLEAGKLADLAVLSQNIFEVPLQALPATEAVLTMVGGMIIRDSR